MDMYNEFFKKCINFFFCCNFYNYTFEFKVLHCQWKNKCFNIINKMFWTFRNGQEAFDYQSGRSTNDLVSFMKE